MIEPRAFGGVVAADEHAAAKGPCTAIERKVVDIASNLLGQNLDRHGFIEGVAVTCSIRASFIDQLGE